MLVPVPIDWVAVVGTVSSQRVRYFLSPSFVFSSPHDLLPDSKFFFVELNRTCKENYTHILLSLLGGEGGSLIVVVVGGTDPRCNVQIGTYFTNPVTVTISASLRVKDNEVNHNNSA